MPKLIIYLRDQDLQALSDLAVQEYRVPKAQAALMIRQELERRGLVPIGEVPSDDLGEEEYPHESSDPS